MHYQLSGVPNNFQHTADGFNTGNRLSLQESPQIAAKVSRPVTLPFKNEYNIQFGGNDPYKIIVNAEQEKLYFLLISLVDHKMWKGEFPAYHLEDISRKTGRELSYL